MKITFKDTYHRTGLDRVISPAGDKFYYKHKWYYDDEGNFIHGEFGKPLNRYEEIQAFRDSVDLQAMLQRYENGDDSALMKVQGMYLDTAELPKNYHELYSAVEMHNLVFDSMPVEIKEAYHNNPAEYWKAFGTQEFDDTMNAYRSMIYEQYGSVDPEPVNTSGMAIDSDFDSSKVEPMPVNDPLQPKASEKE